MIIDSYFGTLSDYTHRAGKERRGADCWNSADMHRAAEERAGASDGHPVAAELTSSGVSQPAEEERRIARDGKAYTWLQFLEYYGEHVAANSWNSADIYRASDGSAGIKVVQVGVRAECETAAEMKTSCRVCRVCGVFEPFEGLTDLCCLQETGAMCIFDDAGDPPDDAGDPPDDAGDSPLPSDDAHLAGEERCRADYWNSADIHRVGDGSAGSTASAQYDANKAADLNVGTTVPTVLFGMTRRLLGPPTNQMSMILSVHCLTALQQK